ncbi:MAG: DMT family transporter [Clostridia bacterium]|nr:DMT family transporter [Clostridia bacterium]
MVITAFFWSGAFIAGKYGIQEFSPVALTFFRFLIASLIIFIIMVRYEKKNWHLRKEDLKVILFLGAVGMIGYHVLFFGALKYTTSTNASIIAALNPIITSVLAALFAGEGLSAKRIGAILLALMGVILTITNWELRVLTELAFNKGDLLMLCAVLCWASYSVVSKIVMPKYSPLIISTYSFVVCTLLLIPFVIWEEITTGFLRFTTWTGWSSILYMAVFPTVIGYLIQQIAFKHIGASRTNIFINLVPVFSIFLATLILHEEFSVLKLISAGIIISGVYLNSIINDPVSPKEKMAIK